MTLLAALLAASAVLLRWALPPEGGLRVGALGGADRPRARRLRLSPGPLALAGGGVVLLVSGPVAAGVGAAAAFAVVRVLASRRAATARTTERARAVEACTTLAAELRAGRSGAEALQAATGVATGGTRAALAAGGAAAAAGADVPTALLAHVPGPAAVPELLRALAACWAVCASAGNGLAAAVERLEEGLRAAEAQRRAVEAELAGPRATAGLLALLPVAGLVLATGLGADPLRVLLHTPVGAVCLLLGVALDGLGLLWTGRLVDRAGGRR